MDRHPAPGGQQQRRAASIEAVSFYPPVSRAELPVKPAHPQQQDDEPGQIEPG